jgi:hypothetical protein
MKHLLIPEAWRNFEGRCVMHRIVGSVSSAGGNRAPWAQRRASPHQGLHRGGAHRRGITRLLDEAFDFLYPGQGPRMLPPFRGPTAYEDQKLGPFVDGWRKRDALGPVSSLEDLTTGAARHMGQGPPGLRQRPAGMYGALPVRQRYRDLLQAVLQREGRPDLRPVRGGRPGLRGGRARGMGGPRDAPCTLGTWRDFGVTSLLLKEVCLRLGRPVRIFRETENCYWEESRPATTT